MSSPTNDPNLPIANAKPPCLYSSVTMFENSLNYNSANCSSVDFPGFSSARSVNTVNFLLPKSQCHFVRIPCQSSPTNIHNARWDLVLIVPSHCLVSATVGGISGFACAYVLFATSGCTYQELISNIGKFTLKHSQQFFLHLHTGELHMLFSWFCTHFVPLPLTWKKDVLIFPDTCGTPGVFRPN